MIERMSLRELLERKAADYGYDSIREMARSLGIDSERLYGPASGRTAMGIETRRWIVRELDVSADVLERVIRNDRLS